MSENKRFKIYIDYDDWSIIDTTGEYVAEDYIEWMSQKQVCDLLNEQDKQIKKYKHLVKIATSIIEWNTVPQIRRAWEKYLNKVGDD